MLNQKFADDECLAKTNACYGKHSEILLLGSIEIEHV